MKKRTLLYMQDTSVLGFFLGFFFFFAFVSDALPFEKESKAVSVLLQQISSHRVAHVLMAGL